MILQKTNLSLESFFSRYLSNMFQIDIFIRSIHDYSSSVIFLEIASDRVIYDSCLFVEEKS